MSTNLKLIIFILTLGLLFCGNLSAQNIGKLTGVVSDSTGGALSSATVMLLKKTDSTLVEFALSENDGRFKFEKISLGDFLLNITYLGYTSYYKSVSFSTSSPSIDLGKVSLESQSTLLNEITVEGERNPMTIKKDTVEYNSAAFQVQPNANVEELLKKLPGVQVDRSGNVQAQGETVNRILV
ncbi:MAG: carboxypeptidase-like regulatory domain-containing protein, partial [Bacteroidota bacterium]